MRKHKFKSGDTVTLIANRKQLKSIGIMVSLKPNKKYKVEPKGIGGFKDFPNEPNYKIELLTVPETFLK